MRRDANDEQWQEVKIKVFKRDKTCRLLQIVSAKDFLILKKKAGSLLNVHDPAHVFAVSVAPSLVYCEDNIVRLNRYSHDMLDNCKDPITGVRISKEERDGWWEKIAGSLVFEKLKEMLKE